MDTPETVVWVVINADKIEVEEQGYLDSRYAARRVNQLKKDGHSAWFMPVRVHIPPQIEYVQMPYPVMPKLPASAVFTPDYGAGMQVAYEAPRRVFQMPEKSMTDVVSEAWASWAATTKGTQPEDVPTPESIARLFEESPSGQLELWPTGFPEPVR